MMFVRPDFFTRWTLLMALTLIVLLAACGVDGDKIETVDDAVKLIQDVDRDSTWGYLTDSLDALADQEGYIVSVAAFEGPEDFDILAEKSVNEGQVMTIMVDAQGTMSVFVDLGSVYLIPTPTGDRDSQRVFIDNSGTYTCADAQEIQVFGNGAQSIFESFALPAVMAQTLSVSESSDDDSILGRDTTHYTLESRLPEALDLLERTDNADLRQRIENGDQVDLSGSFDLDDETGALLRFEARVSTHATQQHQLIRFDFIQWSDVPDIMIEGDLPTCD